uniref:Uncharacterized protein n=2 Tax=Natrinema halophilum TaxID=1699371 RepID=A0A7D5GK77_9EURY
MHSSQGRQGENRYQSDRQGQRGNRYQNTGEQHGSQYQQGQTEYGRHQRSEGHQSGSQRNRGGDQYDQGTEGRYGDTQQYDRRRNQDDTDRSAGRMNREQSNTGLQYRQQRRQSEQGDWSQSGESNQRRSEAGGSDRNQQLDDEDMSNRRHIHERDPTADSGRSRDEDYRSG